MTERRSGTTEVYVIQRQWVEGLRGPEWIDYRYQTADLAEAREMFKAASADKMHVGPWRIIHRVTAVVETVIDQ